ncbi:MAG: carbohydrate kinase family protein [Candidatus Buchananbacteria bacterium]|nr:carbohydrate kinase family protein [Candidatus Buchananbacteria bacterium]
MIITKNKKFDVISVGGATTDFMFYSREGELISTSNLTKQKLLAFEYGSKIIADKVYRTYGGGSANTAVAFAHLGLKTAVISKVGLDEEGKRVIDNLKRQGVDTGLIKSDKHNATAFSMILTVRGVENEHIVFAYRGASDTLSAKDLSLSKIKSDWFYVSSLPKIGWEGIIEAVLTTKAKVAWNPGSAQLKRIVRMQKYLPKVKVLFLNKDEAWEFKKLKDIRGLMKYIHSLGPEIIVITDGSVGAYAYDGKKYYFMKALKVKSADTVGVGDAFSSAFTAALIYGNNIKTALKWGVNNSASVVGKIGAQNGLLSKRQIG